MHLAYLLVALAGAGSGGGETRSSTRVAPVPALPAPLRGIIPGRTAWAAVKTRLGRYGRISTFVDDNPVSFEGKRTTQITVRSRDRYIYLAALPDGNGRLIIRWARIAWRSPPPAWRCRRVSRRRGLKRWRMRRRRVFRTRAVGRLEMTCWTASRHAWETLELRSHGSWSRLINDGG